MAKEAERLLKNKELAEEKKNERNINERLTRLKKFVHTLYGLKIPQKQFR